MPNERAGQGWVLAFSTEQQGIVACDSRCCILNCEAFAAVSTDRGLPHRRPAVKAQLYIVLADGFDDVTVFFPGRG
jgi:hypothetical protein